MRFFRLSMVAAMLSASCCQLGWGGVVVDATVSITLDSIGDAMSPRVVLNPVLDDLGTLPTGGISSVAVTLNSVAQTQSPNYNIPLAEGDIVEMTFSIEANCTTTESFLNYQFDAIFTLPAGESPTLPAFSITGTVAADESLLPGEVVNYEDTIVGDLELDGVSSATGTLELGGIDPIPVFLTATSTCSAAVPEPSAFCLLGLVAVVGTLRKRLPITCR